MPVREIYGLSPEREAEGEEEREEEREDAIAAVGEREAVAAD